jgi:universal stress protein A
LPYKRLLCPVDFSESSLAALRFALSLAKESDAQLTVLHSFDWPADDDMFVDEAVSPELRDIVEARTLERLNSLITNDARVWSRPQAKMMYGKAYRRILECADNERSDVIIMGVRGRNPLDLMLFGSTTNHVVRTASCPVLTVRT